MSGHVGDLSEQQERALDALKARLLADFPDRTEVRCRCGDCCVAPCCAARFPPIGAVCSRNRRASRPCCFGVWPWPGRAVDRALPQSASVTPVLQLAIPFTVAARPLCITSTTTDLWPATHAQFWYAVGRADPDGACCTTAVDVADAAPPACAAALACAACHYGPAGHRRLHCAPA